jgi:type IV secretory pathway VirB2 component (pilin)
MRAFASTALMMLTALNGMARDAAPSWLEHSLHGSGKINTVVAVVAIIILGLGLWMWRMDQRIKAMEERQRK